VEDENDDDDDDEDRETKAINSEFVLGELLRLALHLDYSDEIGRRKMFGIVSKCIALFLDEYVSEINLGSMLSHPELPELLINPSIGVLHAMTSNERDLIRLVVEIISELRDKPSEDDASVQSFLSLYSTFT
jgi:condensin complex subunit 3